MQWLSLIVAGLFETGWAVSLKYAEGFTKFWPSVLTVAGMAASFLFLSQALKSLPLGTAYAIWTGIGAVGTAIVGIAFLGDPLTLARVVGVAAIAGGIATLKLAS